MPTLLELSGKARLPGCSGLIAQGSWVAVGATQRGRSLRASGPAKVYSFRRWLIALGFRLAAEHPAVWCRLSAYLPQFGNWALRPRLQENYHEDNG